VPAWLLGLLGAACSRPLLLRLLLLLPERFASHQHGGGPGGDVQGPGHRLLGRNAVPQHSATQSTARECHLHGFGLLSLHQSGRVGREGFQ
jgi:hypothetical protein